jgi:two-component system chemotaxis response regulator CheY
MAKILIVDDSSFSRRTLKRILEPAGYALLEAVDGASAIERYFLERPDLVLLDMNMSDMHGLEVLQKLRELDPNAAVVAASADIQSSTRTLTKTGGARGFITKPFVAEQVLQVVNMALGGT